MSGKTTATRRPLHSRLIPVPIAGYLGALVGYVVHAGAHDRFWLNYAVVMNIVGVTGAVLAAAAGLGDLRAGPRPGRPARGLAATHAVLNTSALALFAAALAVYAGNWSGPAPSATPGVTLSALGIAATFAAGGLGRSLVRDHRIGAPAIAPDDAAEWRATTASTSSRH